jgi:hypothetical protein
MTSPIEDSGDHRDPRNQWPIDRDARSGDVESKSGEVAKRQIDPTSLRVVDGQIAFLSALLWSPSGTATIDDATGPVEREFSFSDGGRWRGQIVRGLSARRVIERVGFTESERPSRHLGTVAIWRLVNRDGAVAVRARLVAVRDNLLHKTPPAATDGVSDDSNLNVEDSKRG